ncbi:hypothetical protein MKEN_00402400 [Mycena kentingensis (nom. inval.)]|nr:hypothetical protein MKEN_00402400 [Mycena kentingensis (nom. inval.)]
MSPTIAVFWWFTWRDWSMSVVPGTVYTLAAVRSLNPSELPSLPLALPALTRSFIYFILFIYAFDLANQITASRRIKSTNPTGRLPPGSPRCAAPISDGTQPPPSFSVSGRRGASSNGRSYKHWTTKNLLFMSVGSLSIVTAAWELAAPISPQTWRSMLLLSVLFGIVASVQDMRDEAGDRVAGRKTLPILLGASFRWVMAVIIAAAPGIAWKSQFLYSTHALVGYCGAALTLAMWYLAYRVLVGSTKQYHHKTYMRSSSLLSPCPRAYDFSILRIPLDDPALSGDQTARNGPFWRLHRLPAVSRSTCSLLTVAYQRDVPSLSEAHGAVIKVGDRADIQLFASRACPVEKIKDAANKIMGSSCATGVEVQDKRKRVFTISTGSKAVDQIMAGQSKSPGMLSPDSLKAIAEQFGFESNMALENIPYARAFNIKWSSSTSACKRFAEDKDFRLRMVDSIVALFRTDLSARGKLSDESERQQKQIYAMLLEYTLPEEYNIAILLTNQVQIGLRRNPGLVFHTGGPPRPLGAHVLSHASAMRIFLQNRPSMGAC